MISGTLVGIPVMEKGHPETGVWGKRIHHRLVTRLKQIFEEEGMWKFYKNAFIGQ